jgi:uncharacterized protein Yka (UPF0111/DUF47 family)
MSSKKSIFAFQILFEEEENIKIVIKRREIYQILETITGRCKQAGVFLESIVIKYA